MYKRQVWDYLSGWKCDIRNIKNYEELPEQAKQYIDYIEQQLGYPISLVSNGPGREDILFRKTKLLHV